MPDPESNEAWQLPSLCGLCHINHHPRAHAVDVNQEQFDALLGKNGKEAKEEAIREFQKRWYVLPG